MKQEPLVQQMREALADGSSATTSDVDDEQLTLVALGRSSEMPPAERAAVLRAIAADPALREAVAALHQAFDDAHHMDQAAPLRLTDDGASLPQRRHRRPLHVIHQGLFAMAAMLTLALLLWPLAAPPSAGTGREPGLVRPESANPQKTISPSGMLTAAQRDYLLLGTGLATVALGAPLLWPWLRQRRQRTSS